MDLRQSKQFAGVILGLIVMLILSLLDYSWIMNFQWIMYGFNIIMLIVVRIAGDSANGAANDGSRIFPISADRIIKNYPDRILCKIFYR